MSNGDAITIDGAVRLIGVDAEKAYYVVNAAANTFQFAETVSGTPVNFQKATSPASTDQLVSVLGDDHACIFNAQSILDIRAINVEATSSLIYHSTASGTSRNVTTIGNITPSENSRDKDLVCIKTTVPVNIYNTRFSGDVHFKDEIFTNNCYFGKDDGRFVNTGSNRAGVNVLNGTNVDGLALWTRDRYQSVFPYSMHYGFGTEQHRSQSQYQIPGNNATIEGFSSGAIQSTGHGFNNGDAVVITDQIPTGAMAHTRYFVVSAGTDTFSIEDDQQNLVPLSGTSGGVVRAVMDVAYYTLKASTVYSLGFFGRVVSHRGIATTNGAAIANVNMIATKDNDGDFGTNLTIDGFVAADAGVSGVAFVGGVTWDQSGNRVTLSLGSINASNIPMRTVVEWSQIGGMEGNSAMLPAVQYMREAHGFTIL